MKKITLSIALVAGMCASVYAQGTVSFDTTGGGLIYVGPGSTPADLLGVDLGGAELLFNGVSLRNASGAAMSGSTSDFGVYTDTAGASYILPGVIAGTSANGLQVRLWTGAFPNYAAAVNSGTAQIADSLLFSNPTGGAGAPPGAPAALTGMPAMHLAAVPEPSTIALAGLGIASLLIFRRRK